MQMPSPTVLFGEHYVLKSSVELAIVHQHLFRVLWYRFT